MAKYINPFTDWGFKRLFGQEFSKELLIDFLNDLLVDELHVKNVTFMDKEQIPDTRDQRGIIYDVYCETDNGKRFIVEMQNKWQPYFQCRSISYACRSVLEQVKKSLKEKEGAYEFLPVYTICFMNFYPKEGEVKKFRTDIILADKDTGKLASDKLRFIYINLPLFKKKAEECKTDFEKWIYVLKHMEALSRMPFTAQKSIFKKLEEYADIHHLNKKENEAYQNSLWIAHDNAAVMEGAKIEGRAEGRAEERIKNAINFLSMGLSPEQVAQGTGLSLQEVLKLNSAN